MNTVDRTLSRGRRPRALRASAAMLAGAVAIAAAVVPTARADYYYGTCSGVWVVVDEAARGSVHMRCAESYSTGLEALRSAGFDVVMSKNMVAQIGGIPQGGAIANDSYWSYWHSTLNPDGTPGPWTYSQTGAGTYVPTKGNTEGWRYVSEDTPSNPPAPAIDPAVSNTTLTVLSLKASLVVGEPATVSARLGGGLWGGRAVTLEVWTSKGWSASRTVTSSTNGAVSIPITYGLTTAGTYTFRLRMGVDEALVASRGLTVTRKATTTAVLSAPGRVKASQAVNVSGSVQNTGAGRRVTTQFLVNGRWVSSRTATTNSAGRVTLPLTYGQGKAGTVTWRLTSTNPYGVTSATKSYVLTRVR